MFGLGIADLVMVVVYVLNVAFSKSLGLVLSAIVQVGLWVVLVAFSSLFSPILIAVAGWAALLSAVVSLISIFAMSSLDGGAWGGMKGLSVFTVFAGALVWWLLVGRSLF